MRFELCAWCFGLRSLVFGLCVLSTEHRSSGTLQNLSEKAAADYRCI